MVTGVPPDAEPAPGQVVEVRVQGEIGDFGLTVFAGFDYMLEPVTTTLRGVIDDEESLAGLCCRIRDAGLELVSLRRMPRVDEPSTQHRIAAARRS
jgi:hypothetical protein